MLKKYFAGWAASAGHSASSQHGARGTFPADNWWAGRPRQAANRPVIFPFDPSRHVTDRKAPARPSAHALTVGEVAPARTPVGRVGGRPRPEWGGTGPRSASAAITLIAESMPTQYARPSAASCSRKAVTVPNRLSASTTPPNPLATARPLTDARTIRRGARKGLATADLDAGHVDRLVAVGRERALIYKTLVLTGLRKNELRTTTVGQLDLTPGNAYLQLDAADEKNREGNAVALRDDLAADLRRWLDDKLAAAQAEARAGGGPIPLRLAADSPVFVVPAGVLRILDRDFRAAGIPKRDDRGRTVDVQAMRTTFDTLLSRTGTALRTAQAAMRHSDIRLTMGVYTDPRLLDVRGAVEKLPALPLPDGGHTSVGSVAA